MLLPSVFWTSKCQCKTEASCFSVPHPRGASIANGRLRCSLKYKESADCKSKNCQDLCYSKATFFRKFLGLDTALHALIMYMNSLVIRQSANLCKQETAVTVTISKRKTSETGASILLFRTSNRLVFHSGLTFSFLFDNPLDGLFLQNTMAINHRTFTKWKWSILPQGAVFSIPVLGTKLIHLTHFI